MSTKVKGLIKGIKYISHQIFDEEKESEIQIGFPTDVKHVAHIGWDGPSAVDNPTWMNEFKGSGALKSAPLGPPTDSKENPEIKWIRKDDVRRSRRAETPVWKDHRNPGAILSPTTVPPPPPPQAAAVEIPQNPPSRGRRGGARPLPTAPRSRTLPPPPTAARKFRRGPGERSPGISTPTAPSGPHEHPKAPAPPPARQHQTQPPINRIQPTPTPLHQRLRKTAKTPCFFEPNPIIPADPILQIFP
nr:CRIB domain-containing protein RIC6-like [Ipomoea batatas]